MAGEYGFIPNPTIYSAPGTSSPGFATAPAGYNPNYFGLTQYTSSSPTSYNNTAPPAGMAWSAAGPVPIGSGQGGGAGIRPYSPSFGGQPQAFQAPQFTNSMSNWYSAGNANTRGAGGGGTAYATPISGDEWMTPGSGASYFDKNSMMNSGQRGGTYSSGPTVAGGWPQSVSNPQAALASGIYGQESTYGTNPQAMSMRPNQYAAVGPMQITPIGARQYASGQNIYDPAGNMAAGNQMVGGLLKQFGGNPYLAAAAYNWSPPKVAAGLPIPQSVQNYANNAVNAAGQWGQNQAFGNLSNQALQNAGVYGTTLNSSGGRYH